LYLVQAFTFAINFTKRDAMSKSENFIGTTMVPIGKFLSDAKKNSVPEYQRSYAWTADEVSQLWNDLVDAIVNHRSEYFIGPVVVKNIAAGESELIDGQQRITTTLVIISVLRGIFREHGDSERADLLTNWFFGEKDILTLKIEDKFLMNEENGETYRNFISKEIGSEKIYIELGKYHKKHSNHLLLNSYVTLLPLVKKYMGDDYDGQKLLAIVTYLRERVKILILSVNDEADAYQIFETLNDRGRSLDTLDLLKNHLFSKAKTGLSEVKQKWAALKENLQDADPKNRFLNHFWSSMHGRTSTTGLFRSIRDQIGSAQESITFANQLTEASRIYEALRSGSSPIWNEHSAETRKNIDVLRLLDAQQALPILMAAYGNFSAEEFRKLTRLLVVMAVRYNFIGEERTGVAANYYSDIPKPIRFKTISKASHVFKQFKPIYPNDAAFADAFKVKSVTDTKRARYILAEIENSTSSSEKIVNSDPDEVNLEHILPKNINQHWNPDNTGVLQDEHRDFVNRLGNLALVPKSKNKKVGSKSFIEKKDELFSQCTEFSTTIKICSYEDWNRGAIEDRQSYLAALAVKAWAYGDNS
jgi:uncharacterized protein with ParB-like and HNH nuclease domain